MPAAKQKTAPSPEAAAPKNLVQLSIPTPDGDAASESNKALIYAESFTVTTASDSAKAQEARARLNTRIKILTEARMALTRPIDAAKKTIMDFFAGPIATLIRAKEIFDEKVLTYDAEQEELRKAEQRRLDKIAEDERKRLQAIADEATRKANEEAAAKRKLADDALAAGRKAEADKLRMAAATIEVRAEAKAERFESRAAAVVAPIAQADTARIAGTSTRETPVFEITDASKINAQFMMPDEVKIGRVVRSLGLAAADVVGGIKVTMKKGLASQRT
jgi:colicin import membrane protein